MEVDRTDDGRRRQDLHILLEGEGAYREGLAEGEKAPP